MHSTYLPGAAILTAAYMAISIWQDRSWRRAFGIGLIALALVTPVLFHNARSLGPTSPELWAQAQDIIVNYRIPHHSLPEIWLDGTVYVKMALIGASVAAGAQEPAGCHHGPVSGRGHRLYAG